jgi:hypothetical protein
MVKANFFWHGSSLSLYEKACISSFVKNGFDVRLHSFDPRLEVPTGTTLVDALSIAEPEETSLRTQGGMKGCLASFSNIYRYRLLSQEAGWWFDTDVFCLADSEAFLEIQERSPGISVGFETETGLNNAVMYVSESRFARELEVLAVAKGYILEWGAIGPQLVTEYYREHPDRFDVLPIEVFYPVLWSDVLLLLDPEVRSACENAAAGSLCIHVNNTNIMQRGIPKNIMPCKGSYLEHLFASVGAENSPCARLPIEMVQLPRRIETLEKENARLRLELIDHQEKIENRIRASKTWHPELAALYAQTSSWTLRQLFLKLPRELRREYMEEVGEPLAGHPSLRRAAGFLANFAPYGVVKLTRRLLEKAQRIR